MAFLPPTTRQLFALLLTIFLLQFPPCHAASKSTAPGQLCDGPELRSILREIDLPSCLAKRGEASQANCSLAHHFEQLAQEKGETLDYVISRVSVFVFAHSEFIKELIVPKNPFLEIEAQLARHYAFIGVTKCLKAPDSVCQRLRLACLGGYATQFVFMLSGHCSKSWGCSPIYMSEGNEPITLLNMLPYIQFRLLERQAFIAKELGELQISASVGTEYLIQTELNDTYGSQLVGSNSKPVALFVAGPVKTLAYYLQLAWLLDSALSLKNRVAIHVVATPLSKIDSESERPLFRRTIHGHQSYLAIYTKELCSSNPTWVFSCKPIVAIDLVFAEQYTSFILHSTLRAAHSVGDSHPMLKAPSEYFNAFVRQSMSYVLAVMPIDEMLTDKIVNTEMLKTLVPYLGSTFGIKYHPVIVNKATALHALEELNTGLDLQQAFYRPCFFIRMPNGAYIILKIEEPIAILDRSLRDVAKEGNYQMTLQSSKEMFNNKYLTELPSKLIESGHIIGEASKGEDDLKEILEATRVKNRTDAFVEQSNFKDVYNVTNVLVVESDPELMRNFFDRVGDDKPWLVLFTVSWSPLCKAARAIWSAVGQCAKRLGFTDVQLVKVECFEANELCQKLKIVSYPTISMFSKGIQLNTYTGPIILDSICLYVKLAFLPPVVPTSSAADTQQHLDKVLSIKNRAFVYQGEQIANQLAALAKSLRFREVFIHEKVAGSKAQLRAVYSDVRPSVSRYTGSMEDTKELLNFVQSGHLDSVFPCGWSYLPQALKRDRPLVILFHLEPQADSAAALLEHLHAKFSAQATLCHLNLRKFAHLNELVQYLAGLSLPALIALTKPPGSQTKVSHRLQLGAVTPAELPTLAADWLDRALSHRLTDGRPVEPNEKWQPASQVFNFVDQVYHGKPGPRDANKMHASSRAFTMDSPEAPQESGDSVARAGDGSDSMTMVEKMMDDSISKPYGAGQTKMHDEL